MSSDELKKQLLQQKLFRNAKSKQKTSKNPQDEDTLSTRTLSGTKRGGNTKKETEINLTKRAIEEIQRETERAAKLANEIGPSGWQMKTKRTNKRFLANTMRSVLSHNERTKVKHEKESKRKYDELTKRPPKFGARLHSFQSSEERTSKQKKPKSI